MCRAIGGYTQCKIDVRVVYAGVRFEVIGSRSGVKKALKNIQQSFCQVFKATQTQLLVSLVSARSLPEPPLVIADRASFAELVWASPDLNDITCLLCACSLCHS